MKKIKLDGYFTYYCVLLLGMITKSENISSNGTYRSSIREGCTENRRQHLAVPSELHPATWKQNEFITCNWAIPQSSFSE